MDSIAPSARFLFLSTQRLEIQRNLPVPRFRRVGIRSPSGKHRVNIRSASGKRLVNIRSSPGHGPVNVRSMSGLLSPSDLPSPAEAGFAKAGAGFAKAGQCPVLFPPSSGSFLFPRGRRRPLPARAGLGAPGRLGNVPLFHFTMSKSDPPAAPGAIEHI